MSARKINWQLILMALSSFLIINPFSSLSAQQLKHNSMDGNILSEVGGWQYGTHRETAIDSSRNLAFMSAGGAVIIFNISNLSSPVFISDAIRTGGVVKDIYYDEPTQNIYLAVGVHGIEIWNLQNENAPVKLSSLELSSNTSANQITSKPGFIFVASDSGIITVDISDPSNPFQSFLNTGDGNSQFCLRLSENGNSIIAASQYTVELYNVNQDGSINLMSSNTSYGAFDLSVDGNYTYVISYQMMEVLDISAAGLPLVSEIQIGGNIGYYSVTEMADYLYITNPYYYSGLKIYDISNPLQITELGNYSNVVFYDVSYFANHIISAADKGLDIIDVSNPSTPVLTSSFEVPGSTGKAFEISGSYGYLLTSNGLNILDLSNPSDPVFLGNNSSADGTDLDLAVKNSYAYIVNFIDGLRSVDISDPSNPVTVWSDPGDYTKILVNGNYLYTMGIPPQTFDFYLKVYDISNPAQPAEIGSLDFPNIFVVNNMVYSNGYIYIVDSENGLLIADVTDPSQPVLAANYQNQLIFTDVTMQGNYIYLVDYFNSRIFIADISNPVNPQLVTLQSFNYIPLIRYNSVFNDILYIANIDYPYLAFDDVSDPSNPSEIGYQALADNYVDIMVTENYIYLATNEAGLHIYENPFSITPVELTSFTASASGNEVNLKWHTSTETNNSGFEIERKETGWEKIGFVEGHGTSTKENEYSFVDKNLQPGNYSYKLVQTDFDGTRHESKVVNIQINSQPTEYALMQNYPNPFNPTTTIEYSIPADGNVTLQVYNELGEEVGSLVNGYKKAGEYKVDYNANDMSSGIYFYRINSGSYSFTKKMILLK